MGEINDWRVVKKKDLNDEVKMKLVSSKRVTVCEVQINKKINLDLHSHENEQTSYVISGEMLLQLNDTEKHMKAGDVYIIPSNVPHSVKILECPFKSIDIFSPVRTDYLESLEDIF